MSSPSPLHSPQSPATSHDSHMPHPIKLAVPNPVASPPATEVEKMVSGQLYDPSHPQLVNGRAYIRIKQREYAQISPLDRAAQTQLLSELLGSCGSESFIEPPVYFDYGSNTHLGQGVYMNYGAVLLDVAPIRIGDRTMLANSVQLLTATHPIDPIERSSGVEFARPITVGSDCWLGGGVIVCPGVTIGDGAVVGAGAVVTKDVAPYTVVAGNPARKLRDVPRKGDPTAAAVAVAGTEAGVPHPK